MSAAEPAAVKQAADRDEASDSEASAADPKPTSQAAASAPVNKKEVPIPKPVTVKQTIPFKPEIITRDQAQECGPRKMKRAQKTGHVELDPPADDETAAAADQDEADAEEEPSQAVIALQNAIVKAFYFLLCLGRCILKLLCSSIKMVVGLLPSALHLSLFLSLLYVLAEYVVTPMPSYVDFVGRLRYVMRCLMWTLVPTVLGYVVSAAKSAKSEVHRTYADESFRMVGMLGLNSTMFATYAKAQCMHYVWTLHVLVGTYSFCYWASLIYGGNFTRKCFRQPQLGFLLIYMAWNFWNIMTQDFGWDDSQSPAPTPPPSSGDGGLHYWQYATMCEMVERVFCKVEDGPRLFYQ